MKMRALWLVAGLLVAGCVFMAGVELKFGALQMRNLEMQYSTNLTNWNWFGTFTTTAAGWGLVIEERTNLAPVKFWRVVEK